MRALACSLLLLASCGLDDDALLSDGADDAFLLGKADGASYSPAEATGVLMLANLATRAQLDDDAGLDGRAAKNIITHRDGADGVAATSDDNRFDDLAELDAIAYVGPIAFERLLAYAYTIGLVPPAPPPAASCLIISEYLEGSGNYNKAVELFNCGAQPIDLSRHGICLVRDAGTTCSSTAMLAGTLAPGAVRTVCRRRHGTFNDPLLTITNNCTHEMAGPMTFSGNDRLIVFHDVDGSGSYGGGDAIDDAFGHIAGAPAFELWSNMTLRRCNRARFDGSAFFPYQQYFTVHASNDQADFGKAPTATTCP